MRIACVAGFFNPVKTRIDKDLEKEVNNGSVIWIPQVGNGQFNQNKLKQALFDSVAKGATDILIVLFLLRGTEYLREIVDSLIAEALQRSPAIRITVQPGFKNAQDSEGVIKAITAFEPTPFPKQFPQTLDHLPGWITNNHGQKLTLHPRARSNLSKSIFLDVRLIYQSVELLATEYHAMRTSQPEDADAKRTACNQKLQGLGLDLSPSISASRAGEEGDEYEVAYPIGQLEKKRTLELHLTKGSDRDQRNCLRIYFFWDDDAKKVVIGWLPNHLDTRAT